MLDGLSSTSTSTSQTASGVSEQKLGDDLNQFLTLLTTQLKYQDPLDPMDPNEFTTQLVQFSAVEQQIASNKNLEEMISLQQTSLLGTSVSYIGKQVEVDGKRMPMEDGYARSDYNLAELADKTQITVTDEDGKVVYFEDGELEAGDHTFEWDGNDNFGFPQDEGVYTVDIVALDADKQAIDVTQSITGVVTSISVENGITELSVGGANYTLNDIISVRNGTTN